MLALLPLPALLLLLLLLALARVQAQVATLIGPIISIPTPIPATTITTTTTPLLLLLLLFQQPAGPPPPPPSTPHPPCTVASLARQRPAGQVAAVAITGEGPSPRLAMEAPSAVE